MASDLPGEERDGPPDVPAASGGRRFRWLPLVLLAAAVVLGLAGVTTLYVQRPSSGGVEVFLPTPTPVPPPVVQVAGGVFAPGVYTLPAGARVRDAIDAAGGALDAADPGAINLAALVRDGERIDVPMRGAASNAGAGSPLAELFGAAGDAPPGIGVDGLIDLNSASAAVLQTLPNIGPARAADIVEWRASNGPFTALDDLLFVPGIGSKTVDGLRNLVVQR